MDDGEIKKKKKTDRKDKLIADLAVLFFFSFFCFVFPICVCLFTALMYTSVRNMKEEKNNKKPTPGTEYVYCVKRQTEKEPPGENRH